ncbi:MAG: HAD family hydrolase [Deltaproteobacteria bacterium]|nr:HAD family hydrolase [Deltaproteobacteria bacterium]
MQLVIFDIDGTLTQTNRVDDQCFVRAFVDELGISGIDSDWSRYPTVCDSGITYQIFQEYFERKPRVDEMARLQKRFVARLEEAYQQEPGHFLAVPGAAQMLQMLKQDPDYRIAIATGGWQLSALLKLEKAQLDVTGFPAAFADHGMTREVILAAAMAMSRGVYHQAHFSHVTYVGDGVWDVRTAKTLGLGFIGVGQGEKATALRAEGATAIIQDFTNYDHFKEVLEELRYG